MHAVNLCSGVSASDNALSKALGSLVLVLCALRVTCIIGLSDKRASAGMACQVSAEKRWVRGEMYHVRGILHMTSAFAQKGEEKGLNQI